MILSAMPVGAFALTDDVQTDVRNDISTQATSAFGSMLTDAIDTQDIDADSPYFISDLIFDGNNATASYYNEAACTLVVAIYDEETEQMLDSAVTSVEAESLEKAVSFSSLPENFVAKAFLLDENNASLCKPYTCNENTTAYKEFIGKTVEDFDEDRVINLDESLTNNFVVLTDDTIIVNGNNETNVLESADVENDEYVFSNIDEQIKNLRVGDMFYLDNGDEENITVIKVASISVEGDKAVIIADNTSLAEAFEYVKIDTEAQTDDMVYDGSEADEGVTYLGDVDYETGEAVAPADSDIMTMAVDLPGEGSVSKKFSLYKENNIKADLLVQLEVKTKVYISMKYAEVSLTVNPAINVTITVEDKIPLKEISLGKLKTITPIAGVFINIKPAFVVEFSGKLTVSGELTFTLGFGWNSSSGKVNKCEKPKFKPEVKVEVTFFVGFDLKPELTVLSEHVASASMSGVIGAEVEAIRTTDKEENHSCTVCTDGNIQGKLEIKLELTIAKTTPIGGEWEATLIKLTIKIADFYYSETNNNFGWGECPYKGNGSGGSGGSGDSGESGSGTDSGYDENGNPKSYTVTFYDADGYIFKSYVLKYGETIIYPEDTPKKEYHRFVGWEDSWGALPVTMPARNVEIISVFERLPVKLVPKESSTAIVGQYKEYADFWELDPDTPTKLIYGLQTGLPVEKLISDYLTVENDGYFTVNPVEGYAPFAGTGTIVELYDNIDTTKPIETFCVVIFGDVNGDSFVNQIDRNMIVVEDAYLSEWLWSDYGEYHSIARIIAADINKDYYVDLNDAEWLKSIYSGFGYIDQATGEYIPYQADEIITDVPSAPTGNEAVGDIVVFGSYPYLQNDRTYKVESIEWRVISNENGELFLLSEKTFSQPYHDTPEEVTWAECTLRTWLNDDFYNTAFNESEKALILTTQLTTEDNPDYGTEGGEDTQDKIFLLSYSDSLNSKYGFSSGGNTDSTRAHDLTESEDLRLFWTLRTPGNQGNKICYVDYNGSVYSSGAIYYSETTGRNYYIGVRPALKLNLNSATASSSLETQSVSTSLENGVDTLGFSYDKCIAGNTYTLLNVTDYGEGFELSSDNLYYINTVSADENGKVTASFIPKANAENSVILLVGDFGNGTKTVVVGDWYNEYTVTWNTDGETVTQTVIEGAEIIAPDIPEKVGYTFTGWTPSFPDTMPDYDLTFTATWKVNSYEAVFNANSGAWADGATAMTVSTEYGAEIISPENPVKTGYTFTGWTPSIPDTMPDYDLTFTATWAVNSYDAVFDANGGAWADGATEMTVSTEYGAKIIAPEIPEKQGYIFSKWSPEIGVMDSVDGKKFTAEWIPATDTRYTVETYTMNTAGEYEKTVQTLGGTTGETVSTNPEIKTGFALNSEKSVLSGTVAADNSLVLKVFIDRNTYTFATVIDGVSSETKYYYGSIISDPVPPTREGYKFIGWDTEIPSTMPAENVTVTAMFEKIAEVVVVEIPVPSTTTINYGDSIWLHANIVGELLEGAKIIWTPSNNNFEVVEVSADGLSCKITPKSSGTTTFTVSVVDADEKVLATDTQDMTAKAGLWQKIVAFFKKLFGITKTYPELHKSLF